MSSARFVFEGGAHSVQLLRIEPETSKAFAPPKPLLIATPSENGEFPILIFLHGYLLFNSFYSQLLQHIASHGFIVVAPQLYRIAGPDSNEEIESAAATTRWLSNGLHRILPKHVRPNLSKLGLAGHSRGVLVVGSGLGEVKRNPLFPPCAPKGVNHRDFFNECCSPACYFLAKDYGHLDMLDDETAGIRGRSTYCLCKNGNGREPMRRFVGGIVVAFMKGYLEGETGDLRAILDEPEIAPVKLEIVDLLGECQGVPSVVELG